MVILCIFGTGIFSPELLAQQNAAAAAAPASHPVSVPSLAQPIGASQPLDDTQIIRAGDKLSYRVTEDREEAKLLTVSDTGEIELPFGFGRIPASNKTCKILAREIQLALEKDYYNHATVHVAIDTRNNVRGTVYVSGQVAKQGPITIPADKPLMLRQALLLAVPTQWAKLSAVSVVRRRGQQTDTRLVNADEILNKGRIESDIALEPDDFVIVAERGVKFGN